MKSLSVYLLALALSLCLASQADAAKATISWDASIVDATHDAPTGYKLYKGTGTAVCTGTAPLPGPFQTLGTVLSTDDPTVLAGQTVCYEVTGFNTGGESARSVRVTGLVPSLPNPPLAPLSPRVNVAP